MGIYKRSFHKTCNLSPSTQEYVNMYISMIQEVAEFITTNCPNITLVEIEYRESGINPIAYFKIEDFHMLIELYDVNAHLQISSQKLYTRDYMYDTYKQMAVHMSGEPYITDLRLNMVIYTSDNGNVLFNITDYTTKSHDMMFGFINAKDIINEKNEDLYFYSANGQLKKYDQNKNIITIGSPLKNTNINALDGDYVFMSDAQIKNSNNQFIGKKILDCYEAVHDGGMQANNIYTINNKQYLFTDGLLWQC